MPGHRRTRLHVLHYRPRQPPVDCGQVHPLGRPPPVTKSPKSLRPPPMVEHLAASGRATPV